jgi:dephospho-CoA kinase
MSNRFIVGVTGPIGSGKSTFCKALARSIDEEAKIFSPHGGFDSHIINTDELFRNAVNSPMFQKALNRFFGEEVYGGAINISKVIGLLKKLNSTEYGIITTLISTHLHVKIMKEIENNESESPVVFIVESATLQASPLIFDCDLVIRLTVPSIIRYNRVIQRDGSKRSEKDTASIMDLQDSLLNRDYYARYENFNESMLLNVTDEDMMNDAVEKTHMKIRELYNKSINLQDP